MKINPNFNPSWENTLFDGRNIIPRRIFYWVKTERVKYFGQVEFGHAGTNATYQALVKSTRDSVWNAPV
jgi:hypothetical protein